MPVIQFQGQQIECDVGANLRDVLNDFGISPHNGAARFVNCRGFGTCGTCAVRIAGEVTSRTRVETWRLSFPPHQADSNLRLACQVQVQGDLEVKKFDGFWGQHVP